MKIMLEMTVYDGDDVIDDDDSGGGRKDRADIGLRDEVMRLVSLTM